MLRWWHAKRFFVEVILFGGIASFPHCLRRRVALVACWHYSLRRCVALAAYYHDGCMLAFRDVLLRVRGAHVIPRTVVGAYLAVTVLGGAALP